MATTTATKQQSDMAMKQQRGNDNNKATTMTKQQHR